VIWRQSLVLGVSFGADMERYSRTVHFWSGPLSPPRLPAIPVGWAGEPQPTTECCSRLGRSFFHIRSFSRPPHPAKRL